MTPFATTLTLIGISLIISLCNLILIWGHIGFNQSNMDQQRMQKLWLWDKIYNTYESIYNYKTTNILNGNLAYWIVLCPGLNLIWLLVTIYRMI